MPGSARSTPRRPKSGRKKKKHGDGMELELVISLDNFDQDNQEVVGNTTHTNKEMEREGIAIFF